MLYRLIIYITFTILNTRGNKSAKEDTDCRRQG